MRSSALAAAATLFLHGAPALAAPDGGVSSADASVLTFWGLLELERDPKIPDEKKIAEWSAFIGRAEGQIDYAKTAIQRWKDHPRVSALEAVQRDDESSELAPSAKIERWRELIKSFPRSTEAALAEKRIQFWSGVESRRRAEEAQAVERSGANKIERIKAWGAVLEWAPVGPDARAASNRIAALQGQLYAEASSLDKLARVHPESKIEVWNDVLAGRPPPDQKAQAERRIAALKR